MDKLPLKETRIILGAAVIDDVLGLIILAIVIGIVVTGEIHLSEVARVSLIAGAFLGAVMLFGPRLSGYGVPVFRFFDSLHVKLLYPISLLFLLAWLANASGLATIVGAFAAGLIISESQFAISKDKPDNNADALTIENLIAPLEALFAPMFFVLVGMQVNLEALFDTSVLWLAAALTVIAIIGKIVSGLAAGSGTNRLMIGIGMVPRGEVGLIFASIAKGLGVMSDSVFSAIVVMVIATTLIAPLCLRWLLSSKHQH